MGDSDTSQGQISEALERIDAVLKSVRRGGSSERVEVPFGDDEPVGALAAGVNSMIEALSQAREGTEAHLSQLERQIETIEAQRAVIRELSTPVIEVWKGVLCLPIVGTLDSARANEITANLLNTILDQGASYVILDITGIEDMAPTTIDHFLRLAKAIALLGAECVLSGIKPSVAHNMVDLDVELGDVRSHRTLRDALRAYVQTSMRSGPTPRSGAE